MSNIITISDTGIYGGVNSIVEQLPDIRELGPRDEVILQFARGEFIFLTGLVLLAAWRKALPVGIKVKVDDNNCTLPVQRFISNTGFREIIDTGHESPSVQKRIGKVPLQPITNRFTKEATINEIVPIFDEYAGHVEDTNPFRTLVSELCENVLAHSESTSPGYICARVLENSNKAEIAIADTGIGITGSYLAGTNEAAKERIDKGASPLEIAVDGLNSSKPIQTTKSLRSYYGFGLLVTRRLIEENRGQMYLVSGNEGLHIDRFHRQIYSLKSNYPGTFIALVLDLNNPLPLEEIYDQEMADYTGLSSETATAKENRQTTSFNRASTRLDPGINETEADSIVYDDDRIQEKLIELRHYGSELLTRDAGTAIRADIAGYLAAGYKVKVSLDEVTDMTPSVADEAFGKLAELLGYKIFENKVHIVGGTQLANRLVSFVLKTRRSRSSER